MSLGILLVVFCIIFISELPDKSMIAALILGTRYRSSYVWFGAAAAFLVHVIIAVTAGQALTLLPHRVVEAIVAALFFGGALLLLLGKHGLDADPDPKATVKDGHSFWKVLGTTFGVVFLGEWGDITQIMTANYVAKYHAPLSVGLGAVLGLWAATTLAIFGGSRILKRVPGKFLQRITALILLLFALFSAYSAIK